MFLLPRSQTFNMWTLPSFSSEGRLDAPSWAWQTLIHSHYFVRVMGRYSLKKRSPTLWLHIWCQPLPTTSNSYFLRSILYWNIILNRQYTLLSMYVYTCIYVGINHNKSIPIIRLNNKFEFMTPTRVKSAQITLTLSDQ